MARPTQVAVPDPHTWFQKLLAGYMGKYRLGMVRF